MEKYSVEDVFTPVHPAREGFVERAAIAHPLINALNTPGKQIILYGHSGSGKSSLLIHTLEQLNRPSITTFCTRKVTFQELLFEALNQLHYFYDRNQPGENSCIGTSVQSNFSALSNQINNAPENNPVDRAQLLHTHLTSQTVGSLMGTAGACWILEDINKLGASDRYQLAQAMQCFAQISDQFPDLKIIAVGAVDNPQEVTTHLPAMKEKIAAIYVPPMGQDDIAHILEISETRLNIVIPQAVKEAITNYADGLPFVCHELGRKICYYAGIYETQDQPVAIDSFCLEEILSHTPRTLI